MISQFLLISLTFATVQQDLVKKSAITVSSPLINTMAPITVETISSQLYYLNILLDVADNSQLYFKFDQPITKLFISASPVAHSDFSSLAFLDCSSFDATKIYNYNYTTSQRIYIVFESVKAPTMIESANYVTVSANTTIIPTQLYNYFLIQSAKNTTMVYGNVSVSTVANTLFDFNSDQLNSGYIQLFTNPQKLYVIQTGSNLEINIQFFNGVQLVQDQHIQVNFSKVDSVYVNNSQFFNLSAESCFGDKIQLQYQSTASTSQTLQNYKVYYPITAPQSTFTLFTAPSTGLIDLFMFSHFFSAVFEDSLIAFNDKKRLQLRFGKATGSGTVYVSNSNQYKTSCEVANNAHLVKKFNMNESAVLNERQFEMNVSYDGKSKYVYIINENNGHMRMYTPAEIELSGKIVASWAIGAGIAACVLMVVGIVVIALGIKASKPSKEYYDYVKRGLIEK
ncbi:Hypothetical_protein [Hexamita inflata]|uniref:Hypothetical_protein n=1 Tax=Hexamita inflata TaxID=28002 RepID=A0AA86QTC1_9EUKA|nr:Hypothetical protein HINF_LOCUS53299 [Hexamita inflata]